jgi:hypothetical protein
VLAVRLDAAVSAEPPSLLLQRALPELSGVLESSRESVLQNGQQLANRLESRLESKLQGIQDSVDALLQGRVLVTFTGYFGAGPAAPVVPVGPGQDAVPALYAPICRATSPRVSASRGADVSAGLSIVAALARAFTVKDVWREWQEGLVGPPAIRELEEKWGSRWRPSNVVHMQFCCWKVIWDEVLARTARSKSADEAVAELEHLRAGCSLNQLVDELKRRWQGRLAGGSNGSGGSRQHTARGQGRRGRWRRWGRHSGLLLQ